MRADIGSRSAGCLKYSPMIWRIRAALEMWRLAASAASAASSSSSMFAWTRRIALRAVGEQLHPGGTRRRAEGGVQGRERYALSLRQ